ncbi:MAG: histidine phosphatase family protein [Candidatus Kaiserbacteria bacterium]|nr:histidine phosphatase family protein [Candidatus Kaiserbacteria bacterium]
MHVYFVRHGETLLNKKNVHQSPNTSLSPKGRDQSATVAEYLRAVNPDLLITSEYTRARETAGVIGQCVGLTPQVNGLFYEIERPSSLYGKSHFHIETLWYVIGSVLHKNNASWRYKDAENFGDISDRAQRALAYIESLEKEYNSVVVVSHTVFINIMVSYMCKNRMLDIRDLLLTFLHIEKMENTGIVHVEFLGRSSGNVCAWRLVDGV